MALLLEKLVVLALPVFYDFLGFDLHVDELALVLIYLITNLLFAEVVQLLVLDAFLEHLFFLQDHDPLHTDNSLMCLGLTLSHLFSVKFFNCPIFLKLLLNFSEL